MKKYSVIFIAFFASLSNIQSQDWYDQLSHQKLIINLIAEGKNWNEILNIARQDFNIEPKYLSDIEATINYLDTTQSLTLIDSLFLGFCLKVNKYFPYRSSGNLTERFYTLPKPDTSIIKLPPNIGPDNDVLAKIVLLSLINKEQNIAELINYLSNDSATRQIKLREISGDIPIYLSISDLAMELIEIVTYCDFFDNASQSYMLFSNLEKTEKQVIIKNVTDWWQNTRSQSTLESIIYFLDRTDNLGHSYTFTCNNLQFLGESLLAQAKLDERDRLIECSQKIANDSFMDNNSKECLKKILYRESYPYKDSHLSALVRTNLARNSIRSYTEQKSYWEELFSLLAIYSMGDIPKTLVSLMKNKEIVIESALEGKETWEGKYPLYYSSKFRVCDFALVKFNELIKQQEIGDWMSSMQRDVAIQRIIAEYGD